MKKNVETYNIKINIEKITFPNWTMNEIIAYQSLVRVYHVNVPLSLNIMTHSILKKSIKCATGNVLEFALVLSY